MPCELLNKFLVAPPQNLCQFNLKQVSAKFYHLKTVLLKGKKKNERETKIETFLPSLLWLTLDHLPQAEMPFFYFSSYYKDNCFKIYFYGFRVS